MDKKTLLALLAVGGGAASVKVYKDDEGTKVTSRSGPLLIADALSKIPVKRPRVSHFPTHYQVPDPMTPDPINNDDGEGIMGQTTLPKTFKITDRFVLNPRNDGNMSAVVPGRPGEWFIGFSGPEAIHENQSNRFERHVLNGKTEFGLPTTDYVDECYIPRAGHLTAFGVLGDSDLFWTKYKNGVGQFAYSPGTVRNIKPLDTFSGSSEAQLSLSPSRTYCVVRERRGGHAFFYRRRVADLKAGRDAPMGRRIDINVRGRITQSFSIVRESLFVVFGAARSRAWVEEWSFATGKKIGTNYNVTKYGTHVVPGNYEMEMAPGRYLMGKVGSGVKRRIIIGEHNL